MIQYTRGKITKQAHVGIPEGMCEEEFGRKGFFGRYAHPHSAVVLLQLDVVDLPVRPEPVLDALRQCIPAILPHAVQTPHIRGNSKRTRETAAKQK